MNEDAPVNSAAAGAVAGIGVGPTGEPGVKKSKSNKTTRGILSFKKFAKE